MTIPIYVAPGNNLRGLAEFHGFDQDPVGLSKKKEPVKCGFKLTDIETLFATESSRDSHVCVYTVQDTEGTFLERIPRLTKPVLDQVLAAGWQVNCFSVWIDLDLKDLVGRHGKLEPPKLKWIELTPDETGMVWKKIEDALDALKAKGMPWVASYNTESGLRFIHVLAVPVPAGAPYEALVARFLSAYALVGLPADEACKDWTRLFRAPRVTKESGQTTWDQEWSGQAIDLDDDGAFYAPSEKDLRPVDVAPTVDIERTTTRGIPDPTAAQALVEFYDDEQRKMRPTEPAKAAKRLLTDTGVFPWIYQKMPLAFPGKRHEMMTRAIGEVVGTLHGTLNVTPEFIFGLLYEPVGRFGEDPEENWIGKLWEMTTSFWDKEELKKAQKAAIVAEAVAEHEAVTETKAGRFLKGVRTWLPEIATMPDEDALEHIRKARIGVIQDARRDQFHVLMGNGYYDEHPCGPSTLARIIEQRDMTWLVPTEFSKDDGKGNMQVAKLPTNIVIERNVRVYSSEEIRLDKRGSYMRRDFEGREVFVHVPFYLRDDIEPEFVPAIYDLWMAAAGGNEALGVQMLVALGNLLLFQYGPTAAVCLHGHGNSGKSLVALGLAECISTRRLAEGSTLVDNFNDPLRQSPIVHVDEALDRGSKGIDASASLRRLITSTHTAIEQKGKDKVWMQGVHRILLTANSPDIIVSLLGGKVRSESDMRAIAERIAIFQMHKQAADWLTKHNQGWRETRTWIGTHGKTGLYAKFWFWVVQSLIEWEGGRPKMQGRRLLFEGNAHNSLLQEIEADTGPTPDIAVALNRLVTQTNKPKVAVMHGRVWIQRYAIVEEVQQRNNKWRPDQIKQALTALEADEQPDRISIKGVQARWRALDGQRVLRLIEAQTVPNVAFDEFK